MENSTAEDKKFVNEEMNLCANQLLEYLQQGNTSVGEMKNIVKRSIERIEDKYLDTEDKEFCLELYFKIGEILGIDIEDYSQSIEQHVMAGYQRMLNEAGINLDDFLTNSPSQ